MSLTLKYLSNLTAELLRWRRTRSENADNPCPATIVATVNADIVSPGLPELVSGVTRFRSAPFHREVTERPTRGACRTTRSRQRSSGEFRSVPHGTTSEEQNT
jgi:hypothetical protein